MTAIRMSMSVEDWMHQNPPLALQLDVLPSEAATLFVADESTLSSFKLAFKAGVVLPECLSK